jgi:hypothetical protein
MLRVVSALALVGSAYAAPPARSALFSSMPTDPTCAADCVTNTVDFPVPDVAEMNTVRRRRAACPASMAAHAEPASRVPSVCQVFDQLTVAEQLTIEDMMRPLGVSFVAYEKCVTLNCSTIAKLQLEKPPKMEVRVHTHPHRSLSIAPCIITASAPASSAAFAAVCHFPSPPPSHSSAPRPALTTPRARLPQVLAYMDGTGPKPKRIASFWWLRGDISPRAAELHTVEMPITETTAPTLVRSVPWEQRPFVSWEDVAMNQRNELLEPLRPLFDDMLSKIVPSETMLARLAAANLTFTPSVSFGGGSHNVPGSTPSRRVYLGQMSVRAGTGPAYYKDGPMQYTMTHDWETDVLEVYDIVICPGAGNPVFATVQEALDAFNAGTLTLCEVTCPPPPLSPTPPAPESLPTPAARASPSPPPLGVLD